MTSEDYVADLLKVTGLRKAIKSKFTAKKLQEQGLERDLSQIYKPLTESQTKNASDLTTHLSNLSNESNKKLIDFKETFKNFPDLLTSIDQVKSLLETKELDAQPKEFETEEDDSYEHALRLAEAKKTDALKKYLAHEKNSNELISFVRNHPDTNLNTNPWRQINIVDPGLYQEIKKVKTTKKGTGLTKFLPSGKDGLVRELFRLMGSYKSGNKNAYNELNAVVDELRRKGVLSIEQSKKIYKTIS